ncbi:MAG: N-acetylmuramoyl-L-alanine amidase [Bacteroidales bacterium]
MRLHIFSSIFVLTGLFAPFIPTVSAAGDKDNLKLNTVVIDAGHGGHDPGCVSGDRVTYEKTLTLDIAKKVAEKIRKNYPEVKVVLTRSTDVYVTLNDRAEIANRNKANLFISIHINAAPSSTSANGYSIHILGQSSVKNRDLFSNNMEVCKRENSVIMLEDDYTTKYQGFDPSAPESFIFFNLMQNAFLEQSFLFAQDVDDSMSNGPIRVNRGIWQDPLYVLWKTSMPSALIECGFMSNSRDLASMRSNDGRDKIAENISKAFSQFKKSYDGSVSVSKDNSKQMTQEKAAVDTQKTENTNNAEKTATVKNTGVYYGTQVLASAKNMSSSDKFFKGYSPEKVAAGRIYKYIIGVSDNIEEASKANRKIKNLFKDSFLVKVENGQTSRIR